jgi:hypothetical protein
MLTATLQKSLLSTLTTTFFIISTQTSAADREYLDYLDMCVDFVFPYAVAITLRLDGKSNDEATDHIVQLQKTRFSDFDDMDLGATWRIVDDTYGVDLVAWAEQYGEDTNRQKAMWTIKAFSDCLRDTNYLEPK